MKDQQKEQISSILKIIIAVIPILSIIGFIVYMRVSNGNDNNEFYEKKANAIVIEKSYTWQTGRTNTYLLSNNMKIELSFSKEEQISVGDSIFKKQNTYVYDVYKKNDNGSYEYSGTYNYNDVY